MKLYRFNKSRFTLMNPPIEAIDAASATAKSVMIRRLSQPETVRREARDSEYSCYRDTWTEAKSAALKHYDHLEQCAREALEKAVQNSSGIREFIAKAEEEANAV